MQVFIEVRERMRLWKSRFDMASAGKLQVAGLSVGGLLRREVVGGSRLQYILREEMHLIRRGLKMSACQYGAVEWFESLRRTSGLEEEAIVAIKKPRLLLRVAPSSLSLASANVFHVLVDPTQSGHADLSSSSLWTI